MNAFQRATRRRFARAAALVLVALPLTGCFNPFDPRIAAGGAPPTPPPVPTSAANVLRLLQWCYKNRAIAEYREIFTDAYVFKFSTRDSAGNNFDRPWIREDELQSAEKLFVTGTPDAPPASNIAFDYTSDLVAVPDARPGMDPGWHKQIRAQVLLRITTGDGQTEVKGPALFYLVAGDSAAIPLELKNQGFKPDHNRWWIDRWEDETEGGNIAQAILGRAPPRDAALRATAGDAGRAAPLAASGMTGAAATLPSDMLWGQLKIYYLGPH
jgi:hypothetical protein